MNVYTSAVWFHRACVATAVLLLASVAPLHAQEPRSDASMPGRVDLRFEGGPPATVEVDMRQGMIAALAGIGQGALNGVSQALLESSSGQTDPAIQQSAEHLRAINQIINSLSGVVQEVRVRVYANMTREVQANQGEMIAYYQDQLRQANWDSVVRVRDGESDVNVSVLRNEDAIQGIFVVVAEGDEVVIANVACELTPEKIQQVTHQATSIGLQVGLEQAIQEAMRHMPQPRP